MPQMMNTPYWLNKYVALVLSVLKKERTTLLNFFLSLFSQARAEREQSAASTSASTATASHFDPTDPVALEIQKRAEIARRRAAINDELRRAQEQETAEQLSSTVILKINFSSSVGSVVYCLFVF
jgi:hypothetical protein